MMRRDRLALAVGAGVALLKLGLIAAAILWWIN
jgi:hypothetical protein